MNYEELIGFNALYSSAEKCSKCVTWKHTVAHYILNGVEETIKLERELKEGTYVPRKGVRVLITTPKRREAVGISFRDRVYQKSLYDNAIYPNVSKKLIYDNYACQNGKGTDFALSRMKEFLHRYYRKHGADGFVSQYDIKSFYPSMRHDVSTNLYKDCASADVYQATKDVLDKQYS